MLVRAKLGLAPAAADLQALALVESEYWPGPSQDVHVKDPPREAFPRGQSSHVASLVAVQADVTYRPTPQLVQVEQEDSPEFN